MKAIGNLRREIRSRYIGKFLTIANRRNRYDAVAKGDATRDELWPS